MFTAACVPCRTCSHRKHRRKSKLFRRCLKRLTSASVYLPFDHAIAAIAQHYKILRAFEQSAAKAQPAAVRQPPWLL